MVLVLRTFVRLARLSSLCDVRYRFSSLLHDNPPKGIITSSRRDAAKSPTHRLNPRFELPRLARRPLLLVPPRHPFF